MLSFLCLLAEEACDECCWMRFSQNIGPEPQEAPGKVWPEPLLRSSHTRNLCVLQ
jgi:hypothetical protein